MRKIIKDIIKIEWEQFQKVNEGLEKAPCQNDYDTFFVMRSSQFEAWSDSLCESYFTDLENAQKIGRNLVCEKYIFMMKNLSSDLYDNFAKGIPVPSKRIEKYAKCITEKMISDSEVIQEKYPLFFSAGRPIHSDEDINGTISIETYNLCELMTYSEKTLKLLFEYIAELESEGKTLSQMILENTCKYYGFKSLDEAENFIYEKTKIDNMEIYPNGESCFSCGF